jgi:formylglycine-generating enzyme required for sulfatase activity
MARPGLPFTVPALGLELVPVPAGTFMMGSPDTETGHLTNESPQARVSISHSFWLGKYPVTQAEWRTIMGTAPSAFGYTPRLPVESISWEEAVKFCANLTARELAAGRLPTDHEYRLPTEAEREYACRAAGTGAEAGKMDEYAWTMGNSGSSTQLVGLKRPNEWALFDMHGNVWEWCLDWYGDHLPSTSYTDPTGPTAGSKRVVKGGAWDAGANSCRSASRNAFGPGERRRDVGFRVALAIKAVSLRPIQLADPLAGPDETGLMLDKRPPQSGQPFKLPALGLELLPVIAGNFVMGSPPSEPGRSPYEGPQTRVAITRSFWLGKYAVTQAEWQMLMGSNPGTPRNVSLLLPVNNVSWIEAAEFCRRLTQREDAAGRLPPKYLYRLPTEAEWEYVCRAGTTGAFPGNLDQMAWYAANSFGTPHPVGLKEPNDWGFYDMVGNVATWCLDWMPEKNVSEDPGANVQVLRGLLGGSLTDPPGPFSGHYRLVRGGQQGWASQASFCRSASRHWIEPTTQSPFVGLRVALAPKLTP